MSDKDYLGGRHVDDDKLQRCFVRRVMLGTLIGAFVAAIVLYSAMRPARAEAKFKAEVEGVVVTLFDDKCELKASSLSFKAVWVEGAKTYQGCWGGA